LTQHNNFCHNSVEINIQTYSIVLARIDGFIMQDSPLLNDSATEREYQAGFDRVMWFAAQARQRGWRLSDRQLVHEIMHRERAAQIREKSSLPIVGPGVRSAAWNHGQAAALRVLLREQYERNEQDR
jgi:hypothetical protein